ncbi:hypothetical protein AB7M29_005137 [Pseudomonas sp. F-14 TE3623]
MQNKQRRADRLKKHQQYVERKRIKDRRKALDLEQRFEHPRPWAIALSGGGIRSATFSLGVLQALARAPAIPFNNGSRPKELGHHLLPHFDYLSTVSGGGYIGSFFTSLFVPDRLTGNLSPLTPAKKNLCSTINQWFAGEYCTNDEIPLEARQKPEAAADAAYAAFRFEPPGHIHTTRDYSENPGEGSMAWLRENGRYLLPSGAGDFFYALALTLRNLLSVHFVMGMPLLLVLSLLAILRLYVNTMFCMPAQLKSYLGLTTILCDSLWWMPVFWAISAAGPLVLVFWMVYAVNSQEDEVKAISACSIIMTVVGVCFAFATGWLPLQLPWHIPPTLSFVFGLGAFEIGTMLLMFLAIVAHLCRNTVRKTYTGAYNSVRNYRILVTRLLSQQLIVVIAMVFIATVTSVTEWAYPLLKDPSWPSFATAIPPTLIALVRLLSRLLDDKSKPAWIGKLPTDFLAGVVGFAILLSTAVLWGVLVVWIRGDISPTRIIDNSAYYGLAILAAAALALTAASGQFIGFLNLSSLQAFYSSRLARAYLGASNGQRFKVNSSLRSRRARLSVADTMEGDDLNLDQYYASIGAPIHLINVTLNITVDPAEQLVQRDRKGKPLCIAPGKRLRSGLSDISFILDGNVRKRYKYYSRISEINQPLTVSYWIATSGAALTTGLGRATSLGTSLALGLANVRLGTWWPCNFDPQGPWQPKFRKLVPTQTYLLYEFTAHFHGLRREFQYLSDGGHFENTAAYELIRVERDIELIVICDSGCDPSYQFDDLANLTRLARIDQSLEIEVDTDILNHKILGPIFGNVCDFKLTDTADQRCALLCNVFKKDGQRDLQSRILVLKPRVIAGVPADVRNYAKQNPEFPNESTANQFFNETQFESYRQLGLNIGQLLFGDAEARESKVAQALWAYLWSDDRDISG